MKGLSGGLIRYLKIEHTWTLITISCMFTVQSIPLAIIRTGFHEI